MKINRSYKFSKISGSCEMQAGKEYLLVAKAYKKVATSPFSIETQETSIFLEVISTTVITAKKFYAVTNWWVSEVSKKDAKYVGDYSVTKVVKYERIFRSVSNGLF